MSGSGKVPVPRRCVVTGGSGFVGQRLVEMLVDLGAEEVVSFDLAPAPRDARQDPRIQYVKADLTDADAVSAVCENKDCVFHIAALVGPYHAQDMYRKVNFEGTKNVVEACRRHKVPKIVMSSSPSTRFPYPDPNVRGLTEEELFKVNGGDFAPVFLQAYAQTKAEGEKYLRDACCDELMTVAVAPHQVYGPRDGLFLPNLLDAAGKGKLMIFGDGQNRISFTHVDNYCHGLILGAKALYPGSPALGKFYIVTDGEDPLFWEVLNEAIVAMGFRSLYTKPKLPAGLMMYVGRASELLGHLIALVTGTPYYLVMRKLQFNTFAVKMLVIHRSFKIDAARRDLGYEPLVTFRQGWDQTLVWFKENWLPKTQFANGDAQNTSSTKTIAFFAIGFIIPLILAIFFSNLK